MDNLQVCVHGAVVDGRSNLANTAAQCRLGAAGDVDNAFLIALLCGTLSYHIVEGEGLTGLKHRAVDGLAGKPQIGGTATGGSVIDGAKGVQGVLKQNGLQLLLGNLGCSFVKGKRQGVAGSSHCQLLIGLVQSGGGGIAGLGILHLAGVGVILGVLGLSGQLLIEPIQGHGGRIGHGVVKVNVVVVAAGESGGHQVIQGVGVQLLARGADGDSDGMGFLVGIHGGLSHLGGNLGCRGVDEIANVIGIHLHGSGNVDVIPAALGSLNGTGHGKGVGAVAAIAVGSIYRLIHVDEHRVLIRRKGQSLIRQPYIDAPFFRGGKTGFNGGLCLVLGHAAHIDACHIDVGQNLIVVHITHGIDANACKHGNGNHQGCNQNDQCGADSFLLLVCGDSCTAGTLAVGSWAIGSLTGRTLTIGSLTGGTLTAGFLTGRTLTAGSLTGGTLTVGSLTGGTLTAGSLTGRTLTAGSLTSGPLTGGFLSRMSRGLLGGSLGHFILFWTDCNLHLTWGRWSICRILCHYTVFSVYLQSRILGDQPEILPFSG